MKSGQVILPRELTRLTPAVVSRIDPRAAAVRALADYLRQAVFLKWGDEDVDTPFRLNAVREEWAEPSQTLDYPMASIIDVTPTVMDGHALTPTPLECSLDQIKSGTVLWKVAEVSQLLQVDFWCQDAPEREALAAQLPGLFAPGEDTARVVLSGHPEYFCTPVRCSLEEYQRVDNPRQVYESERRLTARIRADIDVVELRCATVLVTTVKVEAGETVDPALAEAPESGKLASGCEDC